VSGGTVTTEGGLGGFRTLPVLARGAEPVRLPDRTTRQGSLRGWTPTSGVSSSSPPASTLCREGSDDEHDSQHVADDAQPGEQFDAKESDVGPNPLRWAARIGGITTGSVVAKPSDAV
jgi:hypothetical protein